MDFADTGSTLCLLCGSPTNRYLTTIDRNRRLSDKRFNYLRCHRCGTLSLRPIPEDLDRYYPADYYRIPCSREAVEQGIRLEHYKLDIIRGFVNAGRLVEIGPAVGTFALAAQQAGFDTSAVEMDAACCEFLRSTLGIPVKQTDDPAAALAVDGPFDVVAMWHVIEHLRDPRAAISSCISALAPGGILVVAAPNPAALQFRLWRGRWTHVDAPRHLTLSPMDALVEIALEFGAEPVLMTTQDPGTVAWNEFGWRETLAGFASGRYARSLLRLLGSVISHSTAPIERRGRRGSTYTLVLKKRIV